MSRRRILRIIRTLFVFSFQFALFFGRAFGQEMSLAEIQTVLERNPPFPWNQSVREEAITNLDEYLKDDSSRTDPEMIEFYAQMMGLVADQLSLPTPRGARIWSMYNHGYIVKTPSAVFAFDLVDGYWEWGYTIPDAVLEQIQVLFVSHSHFDHYWPKVVGTIIGFGGEVVCPAEDLYGTIGLNPGDEVIVDGLIVRAHNGLHNVPVRMYEVLTPEGLTLLHTGDNQTSAMLPSDISVQILLLNAWVNESGTTTAIAGMRNCINKISPLVTIPGHVQELAHEYIPSSYSSPRVPFEWPLAVDDVPVPGTVSVQAWGERYDHALFPVTSVDVWDMYD